MLAMRRPRPVSCDSGTTAVEFALLAPPFLMLLVGIVWASIVAFSAASMHFAVEGAARSYSLNATTAAAAQSDAQSRYSGVSSPTFTASSTGGCYKDPVNGPTGHQVNGTLSLVLNAGMAKWTVPLSATACFP
ncbi:MAG: TadE family protein [Methylocella sp.]